MSIRVEIATSGIPAVQSALTRLLRVDLSEPMDLVGATVESQTRYRISNEMKGPDGTPWPPWSPGYTRKRHGARRCGPHGEYAHAMGHAPLQLDGHLRDSLTHNTYADRTEVGSGLVYAAVHQLGGGGRNTVTRGSGYASGRSGRAGRRREKHSRSGAYFGMIPARPYLGVNDQNQGEIERVLLRWWERQWHL